MACSLEVDCLFQELVQEWSTLSLYPHLNSSSLTLNNWWTLTLYNPYSVLSNVSPDLWWRWACPLEVSQWGTLGDVPGFYLTLTDLFSSTWDFSQWGGGVCLDPCPTWVDMNPFMWPVSEYGQVTPLSSGNNWLFCFLATLRRPRYGLQLGYLSADQMASNLPEGNKAIYLTSNSKKKTKKCKEA